MLKTPFNHGWTVSPTTSPFAAIGGAAAAPLEVVLPHDGLRDQPRSEASPNGAHTGYYPSTHLAYRKEFDVPLEWRDKVVQLNIEGAYRNATVFINGDYAGQRPSGYAEFTVDLTPFLRHGARNTIAVEVRTHEDSRWYTGAGLYRDVWLVVADPVHIPLDGVQITTPTVEPDLATVIAAVDVVNGSRLTRTVLVDSELRDGAGTVVSSGSAPLTLLPNTTGRVRIRHYVREPALWNLDDPQLHSAHTVLRDDGTALDESSAHFGIRSLTVDPVNGLRINQQAVKLRGGCIHHDNGILGSATHARAEERRVELLKAAGYNAVRSSHNTLSRAFLDACDRNGMLVMDEIADVWTKGKTSFDYSLDFPAWWERDIEAMVAKDFNHPSVIMYSIGNEIFETGSAIGSTWGRALAEKVRALDDTRLVTNAINGMVAVLDVLAEQFSGGDAGEVDVNAFMASMDTLMNDLGSSDLVLDRTEEASSQLDVVGINYSEARYAVEAERRPNRILVGSETFIGSLDRIWPLVEQYPTVIGDFAWTAWDYLGEAGLGRAVYADDPDQPHGSTSPYPWLLAQSGAIDILGHRRPSSYWQETIWGLRGQPYIAVHRPEHHGRRIVVGGWAWDDAVSSWSWDVPDGSPVTVDVYSDADEVELLLDGSRIDRVQVGQHKTAIARFETTYRRGELRAVAYRGGEQVGEHRLCTRSEELRLTVAADRSELRADGTDLAYLLLDVTDDQGILATDVTAPITVTVEGPAVLAGLGSADPKQTEGFGDATHTTYDGRALAIIRPTGPGAVTVTVQSPELPDRVVTLTAR